MGYSGPPPGQPPERVSLWEILVAVVVLIGGSLMLVFGLKAAVLDVLAKFGA